MVYLRKTECCAYSTVFDALFLLMLTSFAGVLLLPALQAEEQYAAAGYVGSSEMDSHLLESLLSCKLESFEYEISPFSRPGVALPENSIVANPEKTLFGKEERHRTFADLTAETLALSPAISTEGTAIPLNPLAADSTARTSEAIGAYLDRKLAGRFSYSFEAYWYPVEVLPLGSEISIGEEAPAWAVRQSAKVTMPLYASAPSKAPILACVNDSVLKAALNSSEEEAAPALSEAFNASIEAAASMGAGALCEMLFPSEYGGPVFGDEAEEPLGTLLYGVRDDKDAAVSPDPNDAFSAVVSCMLETGFGLDPGLSPENASFSDLPLFKGLLQTRLEQEIRTGIKAELSCEINETLSAILEAEDISEAQALRDAQVESIYRQVNPGGARIVLSLWEPFA